MTVQYTIGDALTELAKLPAESVHCCVTSPPYYGLRDYGVTGQLGLETKPDEYVAAMVGVFREVKRVLRNDGTLWLNIGDSYAGSGKGGNPDAGKQATNIGSQSIGVLYGKDRNAAQAVTNNVTRNVMQQGIKSKDLIGIPWMLAFALRADGWYLRQDIIWAKPNPMPESVTDRCTKSHEYLFLLSKSPKYYFDSAGISELSINGGVTVSLGKKSFARSQADGAGVARSGNGLVDIYKVKDRRNKRSVWSVTTKPYKGAHFATFPPDLIKPCILAGCPEGGIVLDPFAGAFTTSMVSESLGRNSIGIELNPDYVAMGRRRIDGTKEQSLREFTKAIRRYTEELKNVREPD